MCKTWFRGASHSTRQLTACVNGPLLAELATEIDYPDPSAVDLFRFGVLHFGFLYLPQLSYVCQVHLCMTRNLRRVNRAVSPAMKPYYAH